MSLAVQGRRVDRDHVDATAAIYGLASLAGDAGIGFFYETSRTALAVLVIA